MSRICRNKNMLSELHGRGFRRIVCTVVIVSLTEGVRSPVPSFRPALRPCRKQWRSSFPLDRQAGGADEHSHCLRSQDESAGSLPRQQRWRNVSNTATLCSLWHKPERAPLPPLNKSMYLYLCFQSCIYFKVVVNFKSQFQFLFGSFLFLVCVFGLWGQLQRRHQRS